MSVKYTKEQREVIDTRGSTLLVSAAAGSGKTAVLTERILGLIRDEKNPVDIDRILVVTFTNAAAAEMRERIGDAISKALEKDPDNQRLLRQQNLIHNASICTIDSFCNSIIRGYFSVIDQDPGFRIGDKSELELIEKEATQELLTERLKAEDTEIVYCMEALSDRGSDETLSKLIRQIYHSAEAQPFPLLWLGKMGKTYGDMSDKAAYRVFALKDIENTIEGLVKSCDAALKVCELPDGPYMYGETIEAEKSTLEEVLKCSDIEQYEERLKKFEFGTLSRKKDTLVDPEKRTYAQGIRNRIKAEIDDLKKRYFFFDEQTRVEDVQESSRLTKGIVSLAEDYHRILTGLKEEKNILSFSDVEHLCLSVFLRQEGEAFVPTQTAQEMRGHYREIMVDEYQDSNLVQEYILQSISGDSEGRPNRFMVGDVKQSIYKFRQARPELFMEKLATFSHDKNAVQRKITLSKNFRSRTEVTDFVNSIFEKTMIPQIGGVAYDSDARLYPGASYPAGDCFAPEVILLNSKDKKDEDNRTREARVLALKIKEIIASQKVTDKVTGELRGATYRDIAILFRYPSKWIDTLTKVFNEWDIPLHTVASTGFLSALEVRLCLDLMTVIVNPDNDIPLYNVMQSPMGGFSPEEMAAIRLVAKSGATSLYETLVISVKNADSPQVSRPLDAELKSRVEGFLSFISRYKELSAYTSVRELLRMALYETGYINLCRSTPKGVRREANLKMLLDMTEKFEGGGQGRRGLFAFIRYMEQLRDSDIDFGEASSGDESEDVVRIMSIHKSKGLEFPVCILAGIGGQINLRDTTGRMIWDADLGFGTMRVDVDRRVIRDTVTKNVVARKMNNDSLGEELRVLYVALTRAREKIILTGTVSKPEDFSAALPYAITYNTIAGARTYADFLKGSIAPEYVRIVRQEDIESAEAKEAGRELPEDLGHTRAELPLGFTFEYPHANLAGLFTKTTVTELKAAHSADEYQEAASLYDMKSGWGKTVKEAYIPGFIREIRDKTGAERGSAYHRIMELMDIERLNSALLCNNGKEAGEIAREDQKTVSDMMADIVAKGLIDEEAAGLISPDKIIAFGRSRLAGRMGRAQKDGTLRREQPFILGIGADELGKGFPGEETVLVQGIIDVFWVEEDGIVILDYKTDRVRHRDELSERYKLQLYYYGEALSQLIHKPVKEKLIYSFHLDEVITIA